MSYGFDLFTVQFSRASKIRNRNRRNFILCCSWEFLCLCIFMHFGMKVISVWAKQNYTGRTRAYLCVAGYDTQNFLAVYYFQPNISFTLSINYSKGFEHTFFVLREVASGVRCWYLLEYVLVLASFSVHIDAWVTVHLADGLGDSLYLWDSSVFSFRKTVNFGPWHWRTVGNPIYI